MARKRIQRRPFRTRRHWRIPPPPLRDGDAPGPEGLLVLDDIDGAFGVVLWKALRAVTLWSDSAPADRMELFSAEDRDRRLAEVETVLHGEDHPARESLETLARMMFPGEGEDGSPSVMEEEEVGLACTRLAAWAEGLGKFRTQIEFLQAAALACPTNPRFALAVMRAARDLAQYSRAEAWFHRSVGLARQARDWDSYTRAYLAHGTMMRRRGALPAARRSYLKALRRASRQGLGEARSMALHDLFVLEEYAGNHEKAQGHAAEAADSYGAGHANLPDLAHDLAVAWLQQGYFDSSLQVLERVQDWVSDSSRPVALGSLARAYAGVGDEAGYTRYRRELTRIPPGPGVAEAWVEVARGALLLGNRTEARDAVRRGEDLARTRMEGQIRFMAQSMFDAIAAEEAAAGERRGSGTRTAADEARDRLVDRLVLLLEPTGGRRGRRGVPQRS
jgi:tetratricopeptide (TPR) repeat protein